MLRILVIFVLLTFSSMGSNGRYAQAQDETRSSPAIPSTPFEEVSLADMSGFKSTTSNWQIAGGALSDRTVSGQLEVNAGKGVLVNVPAENNRGHLFTLWQHGDLELDLEVMMPAGSNSGIYFQSRYEIQLFDSWGVQEPTPADLGGIYERWDESRPEGQKGFEGHAPKINVARAPGLWQHLNIVFKAPRFDAAGNKTSPAMFLSVMLNGVVIHEDVALTGPTRAALSEDTEVASGPLMFQGDHGPVAFRNIRYRQFDGAPVVLSDLTFDYYRGKFNNQMPNLNDLTRVRSEKTDVITSEKADTTKLFALVFKGNLEVPRTGLYSLEIVHSTPFKLVVDDEEVLGGRIGEDISRPGDFPRRVTQHRLAKGSHAFELTYAKGLWHSQPTALGWYISGPQLLRTQLTAPGSVPEDAFSAFELEVSQEPMIQRNFVFHQGEKRTHAISVGFPAGLHFDYDMGSGSLLHLWKGSFIDTSTMWYQRGELQSAVPLGSIITRSGKPAVLVGDGAAQENNYQFLNYRVNSAGQPAFSYKIGDFEVRDEIAPDAENKYFTRSITIKGNQGAAPAFFMLAESDNIKMLSEGRYSIDGQRLYIEVEGELALNIESHDGKFRLVTPVVLNNNEAQLVYNFVW